MPRIMCIDPIISILSTLRKLGLFPSDKFRSKQLVKIILHALLYVVVMSINVFSAAKAIEIGSGMEFNRVTCLIIPIIQLFSKGLTVLINKKHFVLLLDDLRCDIFNNHSMKLNVHIEFVFKASQILRKCYVYAAGSYVFVTSVLPFVFKLRMMIPPPVDMGKYMLLYKIIHFLVAIYFSVTSICFDVMFMSLIGLCMAQLNILREQLMNVFEESREVFENSKISQIMTENEDRTNRYFIAEQTILKQCIALHQRINIFVDNLIMILSLPLLMQYACGCFVFCNSIVLVTIMGERSIGNIMAIITYSVLTFSQMAVYHWLGNEIDFKSSNIIDACYLSGWYKLNINSQRLLLMLMERTKRPFTIHLYKLVFISLKSLGEIVRWAYSLFALIKARYN